MKLFYKHYPCQHSGGPDTTEDKTENLIVLHGLFGNQGNWAMHAKRLAEHFSVYAFDARNHGRSQWQDTMSYQEMAQDLIDTMDSLGLENSHIVAHSMGGKTAMQLALIAPERVSKLIVVDIAPVDYLSVAYAVLDGLKVIDVDTIASRFQADEVLADYVEEKPVRDFLLSNLQRDGKGFRWRFNLKAFVEQYPEIKGGLNPTGVYQEDVLFIKGGNSDYIQEEHRDEILKLFPKTKIKIIQNAGHWVHSEKPDAFIKVVEDYLLR